MPESLNYSPHHNWEERVLNRLGNLQSADFLAEDWQDQTLALEFSLKFKAVSERNVGFLAYARECALKALAVHVGSGDESQLERYRQQLQDLDFGLQYGSLELSPKHKPYHVIYNEENQPLLSLFEYKSNSESRDVTVGTDTLSLPTGVRIHVFNWVDFLGEPVTVVLDTNLDGQTGTERIYSGTIPTSDMILFYQDGLSAATYKPSDGIARSVMYRKEHQRVGLVNRRDTYEKDISTGLLAPISLVRSMWTHNSQELSNIPYTPTVPSDEVQLSPYILQSEKIPTLSTVRVIYEHRQNVQLVSIQKRGDYQNNPNKQYGTFMIINRIQQRGIEVPVNHSLGNLDRIWSGEVGVNVAVAVTPSQHIAAYTNDDMVSSRIIEGSLARTLLGKHDDPVELAVLVELKDQPDSQAFLIGLDGYLLPVCLVADTFDNIVPEEVQYVSGLKPISFSNS